MYSKCWQIIRDDSRKTYEICGQDANNNYFTNSVYGMQKAGMTVSGMTPPVTNKSSSKEAIKIVGYTKEEGLYTRLQKEYRDITRSQMDDY
jgi:hypothetical protein